MRRAFCGTLPANVWTRVTLNVHTGTGAFDVLINGAPTRLDGLY